MREARSKWDHQKDKATVSPLKLKGTPNRSDKGRTALDNKVSPTQLSVIVYTNGKIKLYWKYE